MAVERMFAFHWRGDDRFLPENPSIGAVQTEKDARLLLRNGCDREDAIVPNNRRGVTKPGQLGFPCDIIAGIPSARDTRFEARAVTAWSAPARPVFCIRRERRDCEDQARPDRDCGTV